MEEQLIKKLGLQNHTNLLGKTTELLRLLELKSSAAVSGINDYAKITICIDLATTLLGITTDLVDIIKLSGLKKSAYEKQKRNFQKTLDLNKPPGINEICVHLNCNEVARKANDLLNLYKEHTKNKNEIDVDLSHPQYAAMAVFEACKMNNIKILKAKILKYSYLRPSQWARLEQQWDKLIKEHANEMKTLKSKLTNVSNDADETKAQKVNLRENVIREIEDYETWKARIIKRAKEEIKKIKQEHLEKEILVPDDSF